MNQKQKFEVLSAYLDGEQIDDFQLEEVLADEKMLKKWDVYSRINATIKGDIPSSNIDFAHFSENVAHAIEKEPIYSSSIPIVANDDNIVTKSEFKKNFGKRFSSMFRSFGQVAIAASVACVCVLGVQLYRDSDSVSNLPFQEQSYMNATGVSMAPVSNTSGNITPTIPLNSSSLNTSYSKDYKALDAEQLKKIEKQKNKELKTIDALIYDHDMMKRTMITNN
jgi:negative regulator of sigma E activity